MTRFGDIRRLGSVDSTNRYLVDLARAGAAEGIVVVADHQTAGRGRLGRTWEAPPGQALLASVLLRPRGLAPDRRHLVTAAMALAAADACGSVAGVTPEIKWPNDLLVGDRKLAGILATADGDAIVAGIGLNMGWAPTGAVSLIEMTRRRVSPSGLLAGLLEGLEARCDRWDEVATEYRLRCTTVGRQVRVELPGRTLVGLADGIDERGWLWLLPDGGGDPVAVTAADVVHSYH